MEWSLMNIGVRVDYSKQKDHIILHQGSTLGDLPTKVKAIKITTEDMTVGGYDVQDCHSGPHRGSEGGGWGTAQDRDQT